jgi:nicotinamidase/pyrazinamidase
VPRGDEVIEPINRLLPLFPLTIATQDWHPPGHVSFASAHPNKRVGDVVWMNGVEQRLWPDHCVQGTWGAQFPAALNSSAMGAVFQKGSDRQVDSYSAFFDALRRPSTPLADYLRSRGCTSLYFAGLATDYCVLYSVLDALFLGFDTHVLLEACRSVSPDASPAIEKMKAAGARCA